MNGTSFGVASPDTNTLMDGIARLPLYIDIKLKATCKIRFVCDKSFSLYVCHSIGL